MYKLRNFRDNVEAKVSAEGILGAVVAIVAGLYAIAYVLPSGMAALGGANVTGCRRGRRPLSCQ